MTENQKPFEYSFGTFLDHHSEQLNSSGVPPELWHGLYKKLIAQKFDACDFFKIDGEIDEDSNKTMWVVALEEMHNVDENNIFLIDHMLTFESEKLRKILEASEELTNRIKELFCLNETEGIEQIMNEVWKYAQTYSIKLKSENHSVWYLMDEFGSRIRHSSNPNTRVVPLLFIPQGVTYSIMFLTRPIEKDEEMTRDCAQTVMIHKNPEWRKYLELIWNEADFSAEDTTPSQPEGDKFWVEGRIIDEVPSEEEQITAKSAIQASLPVLKTRPLKIYADDTQLIEKLKKKVELVDDWKTADIVWSYNHFHNFREFCQQNPFGMVNQYPFEACLTVKDLFALCAMRNPEKNRWYQLTYNLNIQLPQFVAHFQSKAKKVKSAENVWIVKPWNLARGMNMCVTNNLNKIVRMLETGPKIVCEYISRPLLFRRPDNGNRVKFDLRYIVFVNSLHPITAYVYNKFWVRFAINEFEMNNFDDVETHFTVFNYEESGQKVLQMKCETFISQIEAEYPELKWSEVQKNVYLTIRKALEVASEEKGPRGIESNVQSRSMFGVDIMLKYGTNDEIETSLLEFNFMPDCRRACDYYEDFADTVFDTMFLNQIDPTKVTEI